MRLAMVGCLLLASVAYAGERSFDDARAHFKRGTELYDEGNFRSALIEFRRAHELSPNFKLLYNIGQVHLQLLEYSRAIEAFARYLKEGGADVAPQRREEVNRELERLKTRIGRVAVATADGAEVLIDDESVGFAPLSGSIAVNTGRHRITVAPPGKPPMSRMVEVAGLETVTVTLGQDAATPVASGPSTGVSIVTTRSEPRSKVPMIIGWTVTGALAIAGASLAGLAFGAAGDLAKLKTTLGPTPEDLNAAATKVSGLSAAADVLGLAAIVAGGVSIYLTISALTSDTVNVAFGPGGVTVHGRF